MSCIPEDFLINPTVLEEAALLVTGPRRRDYDHPIENFQRIADMWSAILPFEVSSHQVGLCMIAIKLAREAHTPKRDNLVDIAGYARCIELLSDPNHPWNKEDMDHPDLSECTCIHCDAEAEIQQAEEEDNLARQLLAILRQGV